MENADFDGNGVEEVVEGDTYLDDVEDAVKVVEDDDVEVGQ